MVQQRKRYSRLNQPHVITWLRRCAMSRIQGTGTPSYTLDRLAAELSVNFGISVHRTTVYRFIQRIGLAFAWAKDKK